MRKDRAKWLRTYDLAHLMTYLGHHRKDSGLFRPSPHPALQIQARGEWKAKAQASLTTSWGQIGSSLGSEIGNGKEMSQAQEGESARKDAPMRGNEIGNQHRQVKDSGPEHHKASQG